MKMISFLPADFGPYCLNVLLSMFSSIMFWKSREEVLEEKLMLRMMYLSESKLLNYEFTVTVLAVPDSPQNITGFFSDMILSTSQAYLTVSTVGTRIDENFLLAGASYDGTKSSHFWKPIFLISK